MGLSYLHHMYLIQWGGGLRGDWSGIYRSLHTWSVWDDGCDAPHRRRDRTSGPVTD